ncbi:MAG: hypothetical protein IT514_02895 [Burkholderiales bacterium]|nr:hypothetical protein [Burkholderiales bacterium]
MISRRSIVLAALAAFCLAPFAASASAGRTAARVAAKAAAKRMAKASVKRDWASIRAKDRVAHDRATVKANPQERLVERYTTREQAARELRHGIGRDTHMTTGIRRGRSLSAEGAAQRYGLERAPEVKETIRIPKGHPVRSGVKVQAGKPGVAEITSPIPLPPGTIVKVAPVPD